MVTKVPTLEKPQIIIHAEKSLAYTPFDVKWVPCSARFVTVGQRARGTGAIEVYEIEPGEIKRIHEIEKPSGFKCSTFNAGQMSSRHMATGDFDGRVCTWDLERLDAPVYTAKGHTQIINSIDGCGGLGIGGGAPEIATGSRDGCVKVWDTRQKDRPVASVEPSSKDGVRDCWSVSFGNSYNDVERCVAASYDNGDIKIFDLRTMSLLHEWNIPNAACAIEFDRRDIKMNKLVAGTLEGTVSLWDMRTKHPKKGFSSLVEKTHDGTTVWSVRHLPQNRDIFSVATGDGSIALYKYNYPAERSVKDAEDGKPVGAMGSLSLLNRAIVGQQPVCGFDWSPDKAGLGVCVGFDQAVRVLIATRVGGA